MEIDSALFPLAGNKTVKQAASKQNKKKKKKRGKKTKKSKSAVESRNIIMTDILGELNKLPCKARRLIERRGGSHPNVITRGNLKSYLYLYHELIDATWFRLFLIVFLLFLLFNLISGSLFWMINGVIDSTNPTRDIDWFDCFNFSLQSMDTIGYVV